MPNQNDAGRVPPKERFAPRAIQGNLNAATEKLVAEPHEGQSGHRQIALYKQGHATVALFRFEAGGAMPQHSAPGTVFIHTLDGRLELDVEGSPHTVPAGEVLVLAKGVRHDVRAAVPSTMMLTVCLYD